MKKTFKYSALLLSLLILLNAISQAQPGSPLYKVIVAPDHKDWTYRVNETAKFSVEVIKDGNLVENAVIDYEAGPEMIPDQKKEGVILKTGKTEFTGTMKSPGFYRVRDWVS